MCSTWNNYLKLNLVFSNVQIKRESPAGIQRRLPNEMKYSWINLQAMKQQVTDDMILIYLIFIFTTLYIFFKKKKKKRKKKVQV